MKSICMKRVPGINLGYILVFFIPWMTTFLSVDAQVGLECAEVTYLEVGREGVVSCSFEDFYAVTWYTKEDYDANKNGLIHFNGNKHGLTAEYDVYPNGSFIIRNVTFNHSGRYVVTLLRDVTSNLVVHEVRVEVYVIPNPPYPVVDGRIHQQHVYMDVNRDGELSCSMRGVYPNVSLTWTVLDPSQSNKIQFQHGVMSKMQNEDKTCDITLSSMFQVTDPFIWRITIQCGVANEIGEYFLEKTKVDLLFSAAYPVVNGHVNQNHVYLDVDREGHLNCMKKNAAIGTRLVWVLDPNMHDKVTSESNAIISFNIDGTMNINQTFDYKVHDHSLERITIECKVVEPDTDEHPYTTTVELLCTSDPVISGCYHQELNCVLEVGRRGELTCTVKNSHHLVDLKWTTLGAVKYLVFEEDRRVRSQNNTTLFDISITTPYTVIDESVTSVTIQCDAYKSHSDQVLATAQISLVIQTADDSNNLSLLVTLVVILSLLLVIILLLFVITHYSNRKMYKKSEANYLSFLDCRCKGDGYHIPEDTTDQNEHYSDGGLCVMSTSEDYHLNILPVECTESNNSSDSPDSGNSGSNSREKSGSEVSAKFGLMGETEISNCNSKQGSSDDKRGCSEGDSKV